VKEIEEWCSDGTPRNRGESAVQSNHHISFLCAGCIYAFWLLVWAKGSGILVFTSVEILNQRGGENG